MTPIDLGNLGWTPALEAAFERHSAAGLVPGRVSLEHNHVYRVMSPEGEWLAEAAGRVKFEAADRRELPAVGDWVAVRPDEVHGRRLIRAILPRRTWFSRKVAGREAREQVLAANVDTVFLVAGLDLGPNPRGLERYLVLARQSGATPVVILNKLDVCDDPAAVVDRTRAIARDVPVELVSARSGQGLDALRAHLRPGLTVALLGPSGAGKSYAHQRARRRSAPRDGGSARLGRARAPHERASRARPPADGRPADRHARHARVADLGLEAAGLGDAFEDVAGARPGVPLP